MERVHLNKIAYRFQFCIIKIIHILQEEEYVKKRNDSPQVDESR